MIKFNNLENNITRVFLNNVEQEKLYADDVRVFEKFSLPSGFIPVDVIQNDDNYRIKYESYLYMITEYIIKFRIYLKDIRTNKDVHMPLSIVNDEWLQANLNSKVVYNNQSLRIKNDYYNEEVQGNINTYASGGKYVKFDKQIINKANNTTYSGDIFSVQRNYTAPLYANENYYDSFSFLLPNITKKEQYLNANEEQKKAFHGYYVYKVDTIAGVKIKSLNTTFLNFNASFITTSAQAHTQVIQENAYLFTSSRNHNHDLTFNINIIKDKNYEFILLAKVNTNHSLALYHGFVSVSVAKIQANCNTSINIGEYQANDVLNLPNNHDIVKFFALDDLVLIKTSFQASETKAIDLVVKTSMQDDNNSEFSYGLKEIQAVLINK